jgi:hypothetical protein
MMELFVPNFTLAMASWPVHMQHEHLDHWGFLFYSDWHRHRGERLQSRDRLLLYGWWHEVEPCKPVQVLTRSAKVLPGSSWANHRSGHYNFLWHSLLTFMFPKGKSGGENSTAWQGDRAEYMGQHNPQYYLGNLDFVMVTQELYFVKGNFSVILLNWHFLNNTHSYPPNSRRLKEILRIYFFMLRRSEEIRVAGTPWVAWCWWHQNSPSSGSWRIKI